MEKMSSVIGGVISLALLAGCGAEGNAQVTSIASPAQSFWRFETSNGGGFNKKGSPIERKGEVTVNTETDEACFEQQILGATSAHLHREGGETVVTFFELPQEFRPNMCARGESDEAAEEIVSNAESFYIEFHNKTSGGTLSLTLETGDS